MKISWKKIKDMLCNNVILKVASFVVAVAMWLLVINIEDPQVTTTIKNIPVHILNENAITGNDEAYDILSGETVDIKITGPRTIVDSLTKEDFTATADFKDLSKTNAVPINVTINNTRYESKISISEKSENAMRLSVMALVEKEYELGVQTKGVVKADYVLYKTVPKETAVIIKAPENVHEQISRVSLLLNLTGDESEDFSYLCGAVAIDGSGKILDTNINHMTITNPNIMVDGVVLYKKNVDIHYKVVDNTGTDIIMTDYEASADNVDIVGLKEKLDNISGIDIPEDITVLTNDNTEIEIDLNDYLPDGVQVYGGDNIFTITAKTENTASKTVTIRTGDIGIRNIPDGYEASISTGGSISIVLYGRQADLDDIDAEKLAPYVDLSNASIGENNVRVSVILPEGITRTEYANVMVVITEKGSREPDDETTTQEPATETQPPTPAQPTTEDTSQDTTEETTAKEEENTTPLQQ